MAATTPWASSVLETLHAYQKEGKLCDYSLASADGALIPVHHCVLTATCPKLPAEIGAGDADDGTVKLCCLDWPKAVLQVLVELIYTGQLNIKDCAVEDAFSVATHLGIPLDNIDVVLDDPVGAVACDGEKAGETSITVKQEATPEESKSPRRKKSKLSQEEPKLSPEKLNLKKPKQSLEKPVSGRKPKPVPKTPVSKPPSTPATAGLRRSSRKNRGKNSRFGFDGASPVIKVESDDEQDDQATVEVDHDDDDHDDDDCDDGDTIVAACEMGLDSAPTPIKVEPITDVFLCKYCDQTFATTAVRTRHERRKHQPRDSEAESSWEPEDGDGEPADAANELPAEASSPVLQTRSKARRSGKATLVKEEDSKSPSKRSYECTQCGQFLSSSDSLRMHKAAVHKGVRPYMCSFCPKAFKQRAHLKEHETWHTGETPFTCSTCGKSFRLRKTLKNHEDRHNETDKVHKCTVCTRAFRTAERLAEHVLRHVRNYPCPQCGKHLSSANSLKCHMAYIHSDARPFECDICGRTFKQKSHLADHSLTHGVEKPFVCTICGMGFMSASSVRIHEDKCKPKSKVVLLAERTCDECQQVFKNAKSKKRHYFKKHKNAAGFLCSDCGKTLSSMHTLRMHRDVVHRGLRNWSCGTCAKKFTQKSHLIEHERIHSGDKPYVCQVCNKGFAHLKNMKTHILVHTNERAFPCELCPKTFKQKSALMTHQRIHTKERPFACRFCTKTFPQKQSRDGHERIHTGERPYKCKYCEKTFARHTTLSTHLRSHTGERPYSCDHCDAKFAFHHKRRTHLRTVHNIVLPPPVPRTPADEGLEPIAVKTEESTMVLVETEDGEQVLLHNPEGNMVMDADAEVAEVDDEASLLAADPGSFVIKHEALPAEAEDQQQQTYYVVYEMPIETDGEITVESDSALAGANLVLEG